MKGNEFSRISPKAAAITGAAIGFLASLTMVVWYGMMGFWTGYGAMGYTMGFAPLLVALFAIIVAVLFGAAAGGLLALIYNWALILK